MRSMNLLNPMNLLNRTTLAAAALAAVFAFGLIGADVSAQGRGGGAGAQPPAPMTPRQAAPKDFTGVYAAAITEDWRFRMVTPPKGDFASLPLNAEGTRVGNMWDPQADIRAGEQCRAYGAIGLMRMPTRLRVSWQDDWTLKMEADNGEQVRLFNFVPVGQSAVADAMTRGTRGAASWQGYSVAAWETQAEGSGVAGGGGGRGGRGGAPALSGSLKVVTTNLKAGYHRRNGAPYSANAVYTEFFDITSEPNGDTWLILTTLVDDPMYLNGQMENSSQYKKEPDASKWMPRPCEVTQPVVGTRP
jgi:hypothetical protein